MLKTDILDEPGKKGLDAGKNRVNTFKSKLIDVGSRNLEVA